MENLSNKPDSLHLCCDAPYGGPHLEICDTPSVERFTRSESRLYLIVVRQSRRIDQLERTLMAISGGLEYLGAQLQISLKKGEGRK